MYIPAILYLAIVASLIWGRFWFFKVSTGAPRLIVLGYDIAVSCQILLTLYLFFVTPESAWVRIALVTVLYLLSLVIFWWAIMTAKSLDFAFSERVGSIVTTGPFRIVRHPFYISYILVWLGSSLLFNSPILWITLFYLMTFYTLSAKKEEKVILKSVYSKEYEQYIQAVGMFLPRIKKWMPSNSEH
ncbi:MAG: isoprenylcysteine carboxylmethyltransferase family protein [Pseudomonadales bacterium]|nr:isoprenylcysteine carboxylmethyltransferase family protein [Pseudomonadales bacterium]